MGDHPRRHLSHSAGILLLVAAACRSAPPVADAPVAAPPAPAGPVNVVVHLPNDVVPGERRPVAMNQDIVICGRRVPIGAPVVLWTEPPYYDAYADRPRFEAPKGANPAPPTGAPPAATHERAEEPRSDASHGASTRADGTPGDAQHARETHADATDAQNPTDPHGSSSAQSGSADRAAAVPKSAHSAAAPAPVAMQAEGDAAQPGEASPERGLRYQPGRVRKVANPRYVPPPETGADTRLEFEKREWLEEVAVPPDSRDPKQLAEVLDQFVLHFDVCGLSRTCFRVLQDERKLSVHFLLDVDGTIYQTLDLRETAWHATKANMRSIGIEIANIGAYSPRESWRLTDWYRRDAAGTYLRIPPRFKETGIRTSGFQGRPARDDVVIGSVQGQKLHQYDFTPQQYESLVALTTALCREFPKIRPDAPRDAQGWVENRVLADEVWDHFGGILGHYHVQENKVDPGPAFDWEPFLDDVRARLGSARSGSDSRRAR